jgi:protein SCO1
LYKPLLAILVLLSTVWSNPVAGHGEDHSTKAAFDQDAAFRASRAAIDNLVGGYRFRDRRGRAVDMAQWRGKPLIVSMIYTSCPHFCPMITQSLADAADIAAEAFGDDTFAIVSVGFDTRNDTPVRMASFARTQGIDAKNWSFWSADRVDIGKLAGDLGFAFAASPNGFDHLAQTTIIDADGRVYHQVYGTEFEAHFLVEPLKQLIFGRAAQLTSIEGLINRVRLFCTVFDPASGRYGFDYSLFIALAIGVLSLSLVGWVVVRAWWNSRSAIGRA